MSNAVEIRFLSGNSVAIKCDTISSLMVHVAKSQRRFATDVMVLNPESGKLLVNIETCPLVKFPETWVAETLRLVSQPPPPSVSVILKSEEDCVIRREEMQESPLEWKGPIALQLNLRLHAECEDVASCGRLRELCQKYMTERTKMRENDLHWVPGYLNEDQREEDMADYAEMLLYEAACEDKTITLRTLHQAGVSGWFALRRAFRRGDVSERLLAAGISVNVGVYGTTALIAASKYNYVDMVSSLLLASAEVNCANYFGETALMCACHYWGKAVEVVKLLLTAQASVDVLDEDGNSALDFASRRGHEEIVALLRAK